MENEKLLSDVRRNNGSERCPFCRSKKLSMCSDEDGYFVECDECLARGPVMETTDAAKAAWDGR